jgi:predicted GNAT family N-acyltransferase
MNSSEHNSEHNSEIPNTPEIREPQTPQEWEHYYDLRFRILRQPWGKEPGSERDATDAQSMNRMLVRGGRVVAVSRLHFNSATEAQIRYMAVETSLQGQGIGALLMHHMEQLAVELGAERVVLEARENAVAFYERCGYAVTQKSYLLFGCIQHYTMEKFVYAGTANRTLHNNTP